MSDKQKKPGVAFWFAVVLVVGLAYPLSWGPACWLERVAPAIGPATEFLYKPIEWLCPKLPRAIDNAITDYLAWWIGLAN
jgi:hypothetical protein